MCQYDWHRVADPFNGTAATLYRALRDLYDNDKKPQQQPTEDEYGNPIVDAPGIPSRFRFEVRDAFGNWLSYGAPGPGGCCLELVDRWAKEEFLKVAIERYLLPRVRRTLRWPAHKIQQLESWARDVVWADPEGVYDEMHEKLTNEVSIVMGEMGSEADRASRIRGALPAQTVERNRIPVNNNAAVLPIDYLLGMPVDGTSIASYAASNPAAVAAAVSAYPKTLTLDDIDTMLAIEQQSVKQQMMQATATAPVAAVADTAPEEESMDTRPTQPPPAPQNPPTAAAITIAVSKPVAARPAASTAATRAKILGRKPAATPTTNTNSG